MLEVLQQVCEHLTERRVNLFLGAGINAGVLGRGGESLPLGQDLSRAICRDLLDDAALQLTLDEASEYARHKIGEQAFHRYLFDLFSRFDPGRVHTLITRLPWDTI
jgi:hypothetical protein